MSHTAELTRATVGAFTPSRARRAPARPIPWRDAVRAVDLLLFAGALVSVVVALNADRMPDGLSSFVSMRVTVKNVVLLGLILGMASWIYERAGLYDDARLSHWSEEAARAAAAASAASCLALAFPLTSAARAFIAPDLVPFWLLGTLATVVFRCGRRLLILCQTFHPRRAIIVGAGPRGRATCNELLRGRRPLYEVIGFVDTPDENAPLDSALYGSLSDLESILMRQPVDEVFIALPVGSRYGDIQQAIAICERTGVSVKYRTDIFDTTIAWPEYGPSSVVTMRVAPNDARLIVKRAIDIVGAFAGLVLATPLFVAIAACVKLTSPGPVFFAQERYGKNKRTFRMLKFRTMVPDAARLQASLESRNEADGPVFKIRSDPRTTRFGRFLRKTSLDELPQLVHVLAGEMSLVGPRPLPLRDVARFTRAPDMRRFSVPPGLTCLWQISGRSDVGFDEWIRLDLMYIDNWSLGLDLYILLRTLPAVLLGAGAR